MQPAKRPNTTVAIERGKPILPPCQVLRVRFSTQGKSLAAACTDGIVRIWDLNDGEPREGPLLSGHNGWVTGIVHLKDTIATTDSWGRLTVRKDQKLQWSVEAAHDGWIRAVCTDKPIAGLRIATCGKDGFVRIWDAAEGSKAAEFNLKTDVLSVCFSPGGKTLFTGDLFGIVREHDLTGKAVRVIEAKALHKLDRIQDVGGVRSLAFDPSGKTLLVAGAVPVSGGFVQCVPLILAFDLESGKRLWEWKGANDNEGFVTDLAWHPDGWLAASTSGQPGQGKVLFLKPGDAEPFFTSAKPNVHSVAFAPDGKTLAASLTNANSSGNGRVKGAGGEYPANTSPIQFWDVKSP